MKTVKQVRDNADLPPFPNCPALDGYHCQTNSLAKMFHYYGHPLSEEMLFGLGSGLGFIYWRMKGREETGIGDAVFVGGRGNNKDFFTDIGRRTGALISVETTASAKKAEAALLAKLERREPAMVFGDMAFLPWFDFPPDYHFGGHSFTVCGWDGRENLLASDMDPAAAGLKKGFYHPITLAELARARGSIHKPFPPRHAILNFDFSRFHRPSAEDIRESIHREARDMLDPPIKNLGVKGIRLTARELPRWPDYFKDRELRFNLFQLYVFIEIGGTGGGGFRPMYARFLEEAAPLAGGRRLAHAAQFFRKSGELFTRTALLFQDAEHGKNLKQKITEAAALCESIADIEEEAFGELASV